jgi:hypothetical protein
MNNILCVEILHILLDQSITLEEEEMQALILLQNL